MFSCERCLLISRLKRPSCSLSSHFCFLVIVILLVLVLSVLFLLAEINFFPRFCMYSSSRRIVVSTLSSILVSPLPSYFLDTYKLSTSSLRSHVLFMIISFFCSLLHLLKFFSGPLQKWSRMFYEGDSSGIYSFDKVSVV